MILERDGEKHRYIRCNMSLIANILQQMAMYKISTCKKKKKTPNLLIPNILLKYKIK